MLWLVDQSLPDLLSNAGRIAVENLAYRFWISLFIPEIFTVKVWSGAKSDQI